MLVLSQLIFPLKLYLFELRVHRTLNGLEAGKAATSTSAFSFLNGLALMLLGYKMAAKHRYEKRFSFTEGFVLTFLEKR